MTQVKLVCTSDLHLGCIEPLHQAPPEVQRIRIEDGLNAFYSIAKHAIQREADFLIICGDVFHSPRPSGYVFNRFSAIVGELSAAGVQTLVVAGNHDMPRTAGAEPYICALEEVKTPGFRFFKEPSVTVLKSKSGKSIRLLTLPYVHLISPEEDKRSEWIEQELKKFSVKSEENLTILVSHLVAEGSSLGVLKELISYSEPVISKKTLLSTGADLVLLGHLHDYQTVHPQIVYPGSPERISFSEEAAPKGFLEVTTQDGRLQHRFVEIRARPMLTYPADEPFDLIESECPMEDLLKALDSIQLPEGAILRVKFKLGPKQHLDWLKVVQRLREWGVLYAIAQRLREKALIPEGLSFRATLEVLLVEFVRSLLKGREPARVIRLVEREGMKIIREVGET